jgi:hypothetical protein
VKSTSAETSAKTVESARFIQSWVRNVNVFTTTVEINAKTMTANFSARSIVAYTEFVGEKTPAMFANAQTDGLEGNAKCFHLAPKMNASALKNH